MIRILELAQPSNGVVTLLKGDDGYYYIEVRIYFGEHPVPFFNGEKIPVGRTFSQAALIAWMVGRVVLPDFRMFELSITPK